MGWEMTMISSMDQMYPNWKHLTQHSRKTDVSLGTSKAPRAECSQGMLCLIDLDDLEVHEMMPYCAFSTFFFFLARSCSVH